MAFRPASRSYNAIPDPEMPPYNDKYDGKYHKHSSALRGKSNRMLQLLLVVLALSNVGLVYYFRHAHEAETSQAVSALQAELDGIKSSLQRELGAQRSKLGEAENKLARKENALQQAQAALKEREEAAQRKDEEHARALQAAEDRVEKANAKVTKLAEKINEDALIQAVRHQNAIFNRLRWGEGPAHIVLEMATPERAEIELETAPFDLMPHAVHYFLTLIETGYWDGCHVVRNAHHVIQLNCGGRKQNPHFKKIHPSVAFQEFSPDFHHAAWSVGIAGRPGGPDWYFNLMDNQRSHGPGGQGPEADPCFAKVVRGREVIEEYHKTLGNEFLDPEQYVEIKRAYIVKAPAGEQQQQQIEAPAAPAQHQ